MRLKIRSRQFHMKFHLHLTCGPAVPLLGTYPREVETLTHGKACTPVVAAALSTLPPPQLETTHLLFNWSGGEQLWYPVMG